MAIDGIERNCELEVTSSGSEMKRWQRVCLAPWFPTIPGLYLKTGADAEDTTRQLMSLSLASGNRREGSRRKSTKVKARVLTTNRANFTARQASCKLRSASDHQG